MKGAAATVIVFFLMCVPSVADTTRRANLLETCQALENAIEQQRAGKCFGSCGRDFCQGYVSGITDLLDVVAINASKRDADPKRAIDTIGVCPDNAITVEEAIRVVVKWLKENPNKLHDAAVTDVMRALRQAYPCK